MSGYKKYNELMSAGIKPFITDVILSDKEFTNVFAKYLNGKDLIHKKHNISSKNKYVLDMHRWFFEIQYSLCVLKDIEYYINSYAYKSKKVSRTRTLRYHVDNYIQEIYMLKERLIGYLKIIERHYRRDAKHMDIKKRTKYLSNYVETNFEKILPIRGTHVHQRRIYCPDIDRIGYYDYISSVQEQYKSKRDLEYYRTRSAWVKRFKEFNNALSILSDVYFEHLRKLVFLPEGGFAFPKQ